MSKLFVKFDDAKKTTSSPSSATQTPSASNRSPRNSKLQESQSPNVNFNEKVFKKRQSVPCHLIDLPSAKRMKGPLDGLPPLKATTLEIRSLYSICNPNFRYKSSVKRTVLTNPSEGVTNNGQDNSDANLICSVNDILEAPQKTYVVMDLLGQGTFGQVFRCQDRTTFKLVAVKIIKNKPAYRAQAKIEIQVARLLNDTFDPDDSKHIVRLLDHFCYQNHLCLVFELLGINIYDLLRTNQFRGLSLPMVRTLTTQILEAMVVLESARVIHCDLKPENILLVKSKKTGRMTTTTPNSGARRVKLIDFGSACWEGNTMYSYIQSRFYRSPEVLLGLPYDGAIDMWSLGCVCLEMFLGLPIFPGVSDFNQISRIMDLLGYPPEFMLENGRDTLKFFKKEFSSGVWGCIGDGRNEMNNGGISRLVLKTPAEYASETGSIIPETKTYLRQDNIPDIIRHYPLPKRRVSDQNGLEQKLEREERELRRLFTHFSMGLLSLNPWTRFTPRQALSHPFISGKPAPLDLNTLALPSEQALLKDRMAKHIERLRFKQQQDRANAMVTNGKNGHGMVFDGQQGNQYSHLPVQQNFENGAQSFTMSNANNLSSTYGAPMMYYNNQGGLSMTDMSPNGGYMLPGLYNSYSYSYTNTGGQIGLDFGMALQRPGLRPGRSYYQNAPSGMHPSPAMGISLQGSNGSFLGPPGSFLANMGGLSISPARPYNLPQDSGSAYGSLSGSIPRSSRQQQHQTMYVPYQSPSHAPQLHNQWHPEYGNNISVLHLGHQFGGIASPPRSGGGSSGGGSGTSFVGDNAEWDPFFMEDVSNAEGQYSYTGQNSNTSHNSGPHGGKNVF